MIDAGNPEEHDRYGGAQIRRGLVHFLVGKALTSITGIGTFVLLVRALPIEQFAAYSILFGLVDLVAAVTGVGLIHVMARYVPEVYALHLNATFRELVFKLVGLRVLVLAITIALMYAFAAPLSAAIGLEGWESAFRLYLWAVLIRTVLFTLFSLLESMLLQGIAQFSFSLITIMRFALLAAMAYHGVIELTTVIIVEIVTDVIGGALMLSGLLRNMPSQPHAATEDDDGWIVRNLRRMSDYAAKGYVQHMLVLPFGGSTDRLIVGSQLVASQVALFGFGQWVIDLLNRYLPAQLLQGMIRPVLAARYARNQRFEDVVVVTNLILKVNVALLAFFLVCIFAGGGEVIDLISKGKFDQQARDLLILMTVLMALASWRQVLDIATSTVEQNSPLIYAHTVLIVSVIPGVLALPWLGVYALPVSHVLGLIAASMVLIRRLGTAGFDYRMSWEGLIKIAALTGTTMAIVALARDALSWPWLIVVGMLVLAGLLAITRPIDAGELSILREIMKLPRRPVDTGENSAANRT